MTPNKAVDVRDMREGDSYFVSRPDGEFLYTIRGIVWLSYSEVRFLVEVEDLGYFSEIELVSPYDKFCMYNANDKLVKKEK